MVRAGLVKVLVTGASGFLGSHVADRLVRDGHEVVAQGAARQPVTAPDMRSVLTGPLEDFDDWNALLDAVDIVVHVAGRAHVLVRADSGTEAALFDAANEKGTRRLTGAMAERGIARLIHVSSIAAKSPLDPYSHSKLKGERVVEQWVERGAGEASILRPPILYGPNAPGNLARLSKLLRPRLPLPFASLDNRRSLLSVENAADAVSAAVNGGTIESATFEICDAAPVSLPEILRALAAGMGLPARLVPFPPALLRTLVELYSSKIAISLFDDLVLDASPFSRRYGWSPAVGTIDGLVEMGRSLRG